MSDERASRAEQAQAALLASDSSATQLTPTLTALAVKPRPVVSVAESEPQPSVTPAPVSTSEELLDEVTAQALGRKALGLYLRGETTRAYSAYRRAAKSLPDDLTILRGLGLTASRLGRHDEARRAYARYLKLSPKAADAREIAARLQQLLAGSTAPSALADLQLGRPATVARP